MHKNKELDQAAFRIVFIGTPAFAVPALRALIENGYHVVGVICQPDKPVGRSKALQAPPVKEVALQYGIPVLQFEHIKSPEGEAALAALQADLGVVAAFGQMLSACNINTPRLGMINIHGSLLPEYRGASPIQCAVIDGVGKTGVTIQQVNYEMDTGNILMQCPMDILPEETSGELFFRMSYIGAQALLEILPEIMHATTRPIAQEDAQATYCSLLKKEDGKLNFSLPALQLHNLIRGVNPWPGAYCSFNGNTIKVWKARVAQEAYMGRAGEVLVSTPKDGLIVCCGEGAIELLELQAVGAKRMSAKAYLLGNKINVGELLC